MGRGDKGRSYIDVTGGPIIAEASPWRGLAWRTQVFDKMYYILYRQIEASIIIIATTKLISMEKYSRQAAPGGPDSLAQSHRLHSKRINTQGGASRKFGVFVTRGCFRQFPPQPHPSSSLTFFFGRYINTG